MGIKKIDLALLIETAGYFFRTKGFHGTRMQEIADRLHVNKASLYHHIMDKEALALKTIEAQYHFFQEHVFALAYEDMLSPRARLSQFAAALETYFLDGDGGCLMGHFALELGHQMPTLSAVIRTYFSAWTDALTALFQTQYVEDTARALATQAVARFQGALISHRLGDEAGLLKQKDLLLETFDAAHPAAVSSSGLTPLDISTRQPSRNFDELGLLGEGV